MNEQETTTDIIAEMDRVEVCADGEPCLRDYADRLDRARMKMEIEMANLRKENAKLREDLVSPECQVKPLSLDEAIAHADEVASDCSTACRREHKQLADWLRELKSMRSAERGDVAKLREALCEILSYIESFHKYITPGKGKKLTALFAVADTIRAKAYAALAAPPRNCDKYPTFNDAIRALADKRGWHDAKWDWDSERYCILASWLFAPATEKEGGNNAD